MPTEKVKAKFRKRGRQGAFARLAGVYPSAVSQWLKGKSPSARLDRLARNWRPTQSEISIPQTESTQPVDTRQGAAA